MCLYFIIICFSDRSQQEREQALLDFRKGTAPVLVATAVAARGMCNSVRIGGGPKIDFL